MNYTYNDIIQKIPIKRRLHTDAVCKVAKDLAKIYGVDEKKAETAALFHDMFRELTNEELNNYIKEFGLDEKYIDNINLAHGKVAAIIMKRDYGISDSDVLNAVAFHTTGRAGMSLLEKIIYVADAIEPKRNYEGVKALRELAHEDIDKACLLSMNNTKLYLKEKGLEFDEDTDNAIKYNIKLN